MPRQGEYAVVHGGGHRADTSVAKEEDVMRLRHGCVGARDHRAAEAFVAGVQHQRLAWGDGALGAGEVDVDAAVVAYLHGARGSSGWR